MTIPFEADPDVGRALKALAAHRAKLAALDEPRRAAHDAYVRVNTALVDPAGERRKLAALQRAKWGARARGVLGDKNADSNIAALTAQIADAEAAAAGAAEALPGLQAELDAVRDEAGALASKTSALEFAVAEAALAVICKQFRELARGELADAYADMFAFAYLLAARRSPIAYLSAPPLRFAMADAPLLLVEPKLKAAVERMRVLLSELGIADAAASGREAA